MAPTDATRGTPADLPAGPVGERIEPPPGAPRPSCRQLFFSFAAIGVTGFGGVLPQARRRLVDHDKWMTNHEFAQRISLGQILPGPNIANMGVMYGRGLHGLRGALAALVGLYCWPLLITFLLGLSYARWGQQPLVKQTFGAIMPTAAGLSLGTAFRLAASMPRTWHSLLAVLLTIVLSLLLKWPLLVVLLVTIPASIALLLLWGRRPPRGAP